LNWDEVSDCDSEETGTDVQTTVISTKQGYAGAENPSRGNVKEGFVFNSKAFEDKSNDLKRTNSASTKCTNNSFGYNGKGFVRKTQSDLFDLCLKVETPDEGLK
jgi:hypothetical protein